MVLLFALSYTMLTYFIHTYIVFLLYILSMWITCRALRTANCQPEHCRRQRRPDMICGNCPHGHLRDSRLRLQGRDVLKGHLCPFSDGLFLKTDHRRQIPHHQRSDPPPPTPQRGASGASGKKLLLEPTVTHASGTSPCNTSTTQQNHIRSGLEARRQCEGKCRLSAALGAAE